MISMPSAHHLLLLRLLLFPTDQPFLEGQLVPIKLQNFRQSAISDNKWEHELAAVLFCFVFLP